MHKSSSKDSIFGTILSLSVAVPVKQRDTAKRDSVTENMLFFILKSHERILKGKYHHNDSFPESASIICLTQTAEASYNLHTNLKMLP